VEFLWRGVRLSAGERAGGDETLTVAAAERSGDGVAEGRRESPR